MRVPTVLIVAPITTTHQRSPHDKERLYCLGSKYSAWGYPEPGRNMSRRCWIIGKPIRAIRQPRRHRGLVALKRSLVVRDCGCYRGQIEIRPTSCQGEASSAVPSVRRNNKPHSRDGAVVVAVVVSAVNVVVAVAISRNCSCNCRGCGACCRRAVTVLVAVLFLRLLMWVWFSLRLSLCLWLRLWLWLRVSFWLLLW